MACGEKALIGFHLPTVNPFNPVTIDVCEPVYSQYAPQCGMQMFAVGRITKLAGQGINNTSGR